MSQQLNFERVLQLIDQLPIEAKQVSDFADFIINQYDERKLVKELSLLKMGSETLN